MNLRDIQRAAHENARAKGFHDVELDDGIQQALWWIGGALEEVTDGVEHLRRHSTSNEVVMRVRRRVASLTHHTTPGHMARFASVAHLTRLRRLLLVATEVTEAIRAIGTPEYASELADIVIRVADTAAADGVDLQAAVEAKMQQNAARPRMHGGKAF